MRKVEEMITTTVGTLIRPSNYNLNQCTLYNQIEGTLEGNDCRTCKNKGYILVEVGEYTALQACECHASRLSRSLIHKSGLSKMVHEYTLDSYLVKEQWQHYIKNKALEFMIHHDRCWFYIGGQVGVGKTHICTAIVNKLMEQGHPARYMLWRDEIVKLKAITMESADYQQAIMAWKEIKVLYIDDLFKSEKGKPPTQADIQIAFEIINYRYNNKELITLFSSEKLVNEMLDIDEAIGSRIVQMAKYYIIEIHPDKRKNMRLK
ncbi:MAG: hypothetical protein CVU94_07465 [Firmicutes bacterium HGW-Firmicutes-19]|nr:MAG: hypothetical protein CVU94_07465 [Firmicutes bacterium HGW-Firmicutes-19]